MSHHTNHLSPQVQHTKSAPTMPTASHHIDVSSASDADIAKRAYEKFEARGRVHGFDQEDWTAASHELIGETFGHLSLHTRLDAS